MRISRRNYTPGQRVYLAMPQSHNQLKLHFERWGAGARNGVLINGVFIVPPMGFYHGGLNHSSPTGNPVGGSSLLGSLGMQGSTRARLDITSTSTVQKLCLSIILLTWITEKPEKCVR